MGLSERLAVVDRLLADPPSIHQMDASDPRALGVWSTDPDCYRFLAARCDRGTRTLETGSGLSTTLFAALGTVHRCVTPGLSEATRLRAYCDERDISLADVTFDIGSSHERLPLVTDPLDLVLIDGGHGFPLPIIDWFYAGSLLRRGGVMVVDDLQLPAVRTLVAFLAVDARWRPLERTEKWAAWERLSEGSLAENWTVQPFYVVHERGPKAFVHRVIARGRRELDRLRR